MHRSLLSAFTCGTLLIASALSLPANAATSGTIKASTTVPATCSVVGNEGISLALADDGLLGSGTVSLQANGGGVDFQLTQPLLIVPAAASISAHNAVVRLAENGTVLVEADRGDINRKLTSSAPIAKNLIATVKITNNSDLGFLPGYYEVISTLSCITN
ncbi:MAG: hypothetical protein ACK55X_14965 [Synechococcaceae cyanobacterium]|jgi:hypothetical protein